MEKKLKKKIWAGILVFVLLGVPISAYAASNYHTTLSFTTALKSSTRYFAGSHVGIGLASMTPHAHFSTYNVTLYRKNTFTTDKIGTAKLLSNGSSRKEWTNVGSGNYYFYFSKGTDGSRTTSNNVHLYSK